MGRIFTELFKRECQDRFQISEEMVSDVLQNPDAQQTINYESLRVELFSKRISYSIDEQYLLVCTHTQDGDILIDFAFRLLTDLVHELRTTEPILLLQQFALRFGLTIHIGHELSKFILMAAIPINPKNTSSELVKVLNPQNHSFIQSFFIRISQQNATTVANCALAYCIDVDDYLAWLNSAKGTSIHDNVSIDIAPQLLKQIIPLDLIVARGTLTFVMNLTQPDLKAGLLFRVMSEDYHLEVGFSDKAFYITRSGQRLEYPNILIAPGYAMYFAMWQPTELSLVVLDKSFSEIVSTCTDNTTEVEKRTKRIKTPPVFPPNSLIAWARWHAIAPKVTYESKASFYQEAALALQMIPDKITTAGMQGAFWDITYEGSKIVSRKPKREPDITPTLHGLLFDIAVAKNFEITPEYKIGVGKLDFLISGNILLGEKASVCVEFKEAHSPDLQHGLIKQLPEYMRAKGCDFGVYIVLFFKGPYFSEPIRSSIIDIDNALVQWAGDAGLSNIRRMIFDLSHPIPPSRL